MHIYKITNIINNKVYIGQTTRSYATGRWSTHKNKLSNGTHKNPHLLASWQKYGSEVWQFEVLDSSAKTTEELDDLEIYYIQLYKSNNSRYGYNIASGGTKQFTLSESARKKISESSKNRIVSEETKEKIRVSSLGRKLPKRTDEYKKRQSELKKLWWQENRDRMISVRRLQMTDELKKQISNTKKEQFKIHGHNQARYWPAFIDPNGNVHDSIFDMSRFSEQHSLNASVMRQIAYGDKKSYKGWKLHKPQN